MAHLREQPSRKILSPDAAGPETDGQRRRNLGARGARRRQLVEVCLTPEESAMSWLNRLALVFRRRELDHDLEEELRSHLEMRAEDSISAGMSKEEAELDARRRFGNQALLMEETRRTHLLVWLETVFQDLRYGLRLLRKSPGFAAVALATIALGIGANTAVFSVINTVLLRSFPFSEPERVMRLYEQRPRESLLNNVVSPADYLDWQAQTSVYENVAAYVPASFPLTDGDMPEAVFGIAATANYFRTLKAEPLLGRTFLPGEDQAGSNDVAILSHALWVRRYSAAKDIVGRKTLIEGKPVLVIGVMPAAFTLPDKIFQIWTPLPFTAEDRANRANHYLNVVARLRPGVTLRQMAADNEVLSARLEKQYPDVNKGHAMRAVPLPEDMSAEIRPALLVIFAAVLLVLLISCANVANLLLTRDSARAREFGVRAALGASSRRLLRQCLIESMLLALFGGLLGVLVACGETWIIGRMWPRSLPEIETFTLDLRVLAFCAFASIVSGLAFGLLPGFSVRTAGITERLKEGLQVVGGNRGRLRNFLVVTEFILALVLLTNGGLMLKSFVRMQQVELGFDPENISVMGVGLPSAQYKAEQSAAFFSELLGRVQSLPGVTAVGGINLLPMSGMDSRRGFQWEGYDPGTQTSRAHPRIVTPRYFAAMRIPLLQGRAFTDADSKDAAPVAIINQAAAHKYSANTNLIGKHVAMNGTPLVMRTVVGVSGNVRHWGLEQDVNPEVYFPYRQIPTNNMSFAVRAPAALSSLDSSLREQVRALDRQLPPPTVSPMDTLIANSSSVRRFNTLLLGAFALQAMLLAAIGIYGVISCGVPQRRRESGIRMALGAQPGQVLRLVLRRAVLLLGISTVLGLRSEERRVG